MSLIEEVKELETQLKKHYPGLCIPERLTMAITMQQTKHITNALKELKEAIEEQKEIRYINKS